MSHRAVLAALISLVVAAPAHAVPYTVNVAMGGGASDANPCTAAQPCATIAHAVAIVGGSGTVNIGPGTFHESVGIAKRLFIVGAGSGDTSTDTIIDAPKGQTALVMKGGGSLAHLRLVGMTDNGGVQPGGGGVQLLTSGGPRTYTVDDVTAISGAGLVEGIGIFANAPSVQEPIDVTVTGGRAGGDGIPLAATGAGATMDVQGTALEDGAPATALATQGAQLSLSELTVKGRVIVSNAEATLDRVRVFHTATPYEAGAVFIDLRGTLHVRNSIIATTDTQAPSPTSSAALVLHLGNPGSTASVDVIGSTLYARGGGVDAGVLVSAPSGTKGTVELRNTIVREEGSLNGQGGDLLAFQSGNGIARINAEHSNWINGFASSGAAIPAPGSGSNIAADPKLAGAPTGDFTLKADSPLIEAGDLAAVTVGEKDVAGSARALDGDGDCIPVPDVGAVEAAASEGCPGSSGSTQTTTGSGGNTGPGTDGASPDTTAPMLTVLVRPATKRRARVFHMTVTESAAVSLRVDRLLRGRHACGARRRRGCARAVLSAAFTARAAGAVDRRIRALRPGRYRVVLRAVDAAGNRSLPVVRRFVVR